MTRWRCTECRKLVPPNHFKDHRLKELALKLHDDPKSDLVLPYHRAYSRHGQFYQCGPIKEENPSEYHLCFEHFVGEDIPVWS